MNKPKRRKRKSSDFQITRQFILDNVSIDTVGWCWNWTGHIIQEGYGTCYENGVRLRIHRKAYELFTNPIPSGLVIDHLCRNRACCNPDHLEPVTDFENRRRGASIPKATHCKRGHEFTPENTFTQISRGRPYKLCVTCRTNRHKDWVDQNRSRKKRVDKEYRKRNLTTIKEQQKAHYRANAEKYKALAAKRRMENKSRVQLSCHLAMMPPEH